MRITAAAIILKAGKILLIKRTAYSKAYPHCWCCPGGRGEPGESPEQAVVREVREEIGLEFRPLKLFEKRESEALGNQFVGYQFLGDWQGEPRLCEVEVAECRWFTYDEAIKLELAFNYREILEKLRKENLL